VTVGVSTPTTAGSAPVTVPRYMYNSKRKLGTGGSADVFLALQCDDGMELALKRISLSADQQGAEDKRFETEVNLLKTRYGMPGLVNYLGHVVIEGARPHITGDVYSLGLVLHYALVGREARPSLVLRNLEASLREALPWERVRVATLHLLQHLLVEDPDARAWCAELHGDTYVQLSHRLASLSHVASHRAHAI
jgi:serine/threonine protein kinase